MSEILVKPSSRTDTNTTVVLQPDDRSAGLDSLQFNLLRLAIAAALYSGLFKYLFENGLLQLVPDALFLILLFLCLEVRERNDATSTKSLRTGIYFFIVIALLQIFNPNTPSVVAGFEGFRKTAFYFIAFLIGIYMDWTEQKFKQLMMFILILGLPLCLYSFKQYYAPSDFDSRMIDLNYSGAAVYTVLGYARAQSTFSSPFILGYFGAIIAAISLFFFAISEGRVKYLFFVVIGLGSVFVSVTRVNLIAAGVVIVLFGYLHFRNRLSTKAILLIILLLTVLGGFVGVLSTIPQFQDYVGSLNPEIIQDDRGWNRIEDWGATLSLLADNWMIGYGSGSAGDALTRYFEFTTAIATTPHNMFLKVAFELGGVGLALFIFVLFRWFNLNRRSRSQLQHENERLIYDLGLIIFSILFINGLTGGAIDSFPANMITYLLMGITSKPIRS